MTNRADEHLRVLIERLVRDGASEHEIERVVREAAGEGRPARKPVRRLLRLPRPR
jgi:hypothetical protein